MTSPRLLYRPYFWALHYTRTLPLPDSFWFQVTFTCIPMSALPSLESSPVCLLGQSGQLLPLAPGLLSFICQVKYSWSPYHNGLPSLRLGRVMRGGTLTYHYIHGHWPTHHRFSIHISWMECFLRLLKLLFLWGTYSQDYFRPLGYISLSMFLYHLKSSNDILLSTPWKRYSWTP